MVFKTGDSQILRAHIYVGKVLNVPSPGPIEILGVPNSVSPTVSKYLHFLAEIGKKKLLQENCVY